ncbi:hypothetical protein BH683_018400 [Williamsia sp. 1138]|uniref:hypothetical protein n=1 Tax=Williamsia sp. 1138 TaxID=1903117 RepID=UPI000BCF58F1|nr:hypothetical protein [Williamsia sp. 1138]OZG27825.1 hypothetical protein BH683_018400 [Williamsia sp. 1138]
MTVMSRVGCRGAAAAVCVALILTMSGCATGEGGVPGSLSRAAGEGASAVTSVAYALRLWRAEDATDNQTTVLLGDAGDQLNSAYTDVAELDVNDRLVADSVRILLEKLSIAMSLVIRARQVVGGGPVVNSDPLIADLTAIGDEFSNLSDAPVPR